MNDELERLRDVARAAAAHMRAEDEHDSFLFGLRIRPEDEWAPDEVEQLHRLSLATVDRAQELIQALARLAEVSPELVGGTVR